MPIEIPQTVKCVNPKTVLSIGLHFFCLEILRGWNIFNMPDKKAVRTVSFTVKKIPCLLWQDSC